MRAGALKTSYKRLKTSNIKVVKWIKTCQLHNLTSSTSRGSPAPFFMSLIGTCECSRSREGGGGVMERKKEPGGNSKISGKIASVKGQEVDGP